MLAGRRVNLERSIGVVILVTAVLISSGCHRMRQHLGPQTIAADRMPYNNAVAESWKQQTLLNIVKLRYVETPFFIDVPQIVSGYGLDRTVSTTLGLQAAPNLNIPDDERFLGLFNLNAAYSDRPTISYSPQTSSQFVVNLATPLPPIAVLSLIESGYATDTALRLSLQSLNGFRNKTASDGVFRPADPEFLWAIDVLERARDSGEFGIQIVRDNRSSESANIQIGDNVSDPQLAADLLQLKEMLGLESNAQAIEVEYGDTPTRPNQIAMKTRPIYLVLRDLSPFVEVPAEHIAEGRAMPFDTSGEENPPILVQCGCERPADCFTAVCYRDYWFWIDQGHLESKRTFNYLLVMLALADTGPKQAQPTVTIQAN